MWQYNYSNELYHYGVLGMRWGVRKSRYYNEDGSLNERGKKKQEKELNRKRKSKSYTDNQSADSVRAKKIKEKKLDEMSNQELRDLNNRMQLESQYKQLTKRKNYVNKIVKSYIGTATTIAAVAGATTSLYKMGNKALDKIGDWVVKDIKW